MSSSFSQFWKMPENVTDTKTLCVFCDLKKMLIAVFFVKQNTMLSFRRGLVLAHRGKHWTLLQNISRSLLSCLLATRACVTDAADPSLTVDEIRCVGGRTVAWKFSIGGVCVCARVLNIENSIKYPLTYSVSHFNLGGLSPSKSPRGDVTGWWGVKSLACFFALVKAKQLERWLLQWNINDPHRGSRPEVNSASPTIALALFKIFGIYCGIAFYWSLPCTT